MGQFTANVAAKFILGLASWKTAFRKISEKTSEICFFGCTSHLDFFFWIPPTLSLPLPLLPVNFLFSKQQHVAYIYYFFFWSQPFKTHHVPWKWTNHLKLQYEVWLFRGDFSTLWLKWLFPAALSVPVWGRCDTRLGLPLVHPTPFFISKGHLTNPPWKLQWALPSTARAAAAQGSSGDSLA